MIDDELSRIKYIPRETLRRVATQQAYKYKLLDEKYHEAFEKKQCKRFLLASSVEIYGQCINQPVDENFSGYLDCNNARNGYNESKRLSESLCQAYLKQYNVCFVTVRFSRLFGLDHKKDTKDISQFMDKALNNEDIILKSIGNQL